MTAVTGRLANLDAIAYARQERQRFAEMAPRIFLAHAGEDKPQVRELYAALAARGFAPWLDEIDLLPGQVWRSEIRKAIGAAAVFVACLSSRSVGKVGYVQSELRLALAALGERPAGTVFLVPVRLDDCEIPDLEIPDRGLSLRDLHCVDLWREAGFERLVAALEHAASALERPPPARRQDFGLDLSAGRRPRPWFRRHPLIVAGAAIVAVVVAAGLLVRQSVPSAITVLEARWMSDTVTDVWNSRATSTIADRCNQRQRCEFVVEGNLLGYYGGIPLMVRYACDGEVLRRQQDYRTTMVLDCS